MTLLDAKMKAVADRLIAKYGKPCQLELKPSVSFDPIEGETVESTPIKKDVKLTPPWPATKLWGSATVQQSDLETWVSASSPVAIEPGSRVKIDSEWFKVVQIMPVYSGELVCVTGMLLRR